ncbi:MAG: small subunit ribosomal protein [Chthoniobacter sp.]|jgi:small subunit ribosomal protein S20|nr:small subunit ribosomal protein [Chthoniobacter sp.]
MANTKSAAKRARQTARRTLVNRPALTAVKNQLKTFRTALAGPNKDAAKAAAQAFVSTIDKAVKTGRVHKNAANRHKSAVGRALAKSAGAAVK